MQRLKHDDPVTLTPPQQKEWREEAALKWCKVSATDGGRLFPEIEEFKAPDVA